MEIVDHYGTCFDPDHHYYLPKSWLAEVSLPSELDALDILFGTMSPSEAWWVNAPLTTLEGQLRMLQSYTIRPDRADRWHLPDAENKLPQLLTAPSLRRARQGFLDRGMLARYDRQTRMEELGVRLGKRATSVKELRDWTAGVRYMVPAAAEWRQADLVFRPRGYLIHRWPAWLTTRRWNERAAVLALMDLWSTWKLQQPTDAFTATHSAVCDRALALLPAACTRPRIASDRLSRDKVVNGLRGLRGLGVVAEAAGRGETRYRFNLKIFDAPPYGPDDALVDLLGTDLAQAHAWRALLQVFVRHGFWQAGKLEELHQEMSRRMRGGMRGLSTSEEMDNLAQLIKERQGAYLRACGKGDSRDRENPADFKLSRWLREYGHHYGGFGDVSTHPNRFSLVGRRVDCVAVDLSSLRKTSRGVAATQLLLTYSGGLPLAEARAVAKECSLLAFQPARDRNEKGELRQLSALPMALEQTQCLSCNELHTFDYDRPFNLILLCDRPEPGFRLTARFRLLIH